MVLAYFSEYRLDPPVEVAARSEGLKLDGVGKVLFGEEEEVLKLTVLEEDGSNDEDDDDPSFLDE